jgi:hypothetical protein
MLSEQIPEHGEGLVAALDDGTKGIIRLGMVA